ncbi:MAG: RNA 3'-terminal phosphate cyclase [Syntrophobacteraceae bacterium]
MLEIDGATHSGSGTLIRYAASLAALTGESIHVFRIRAKRDKPGLRPQHLQALRACSFLCSGLLEGDETSSTEIVFHPGKQPRSGEFAWDIGTAGSATMLAYCVAPLALFAPAPCRFSIVGGLFQDFAPSTFHMQHVLFPLIGRMGGEVGVDIVRPGYVPKGQGRLDMKVKPAGQPLKAMRMLKPGRVKRIRGICLASHLAAERVSERMAEETRSLLQGYGYEAEIDALHDFSAAQKGAAMLLWAETDTGCLIGADQAGKRGRRSEDIAAFVVRSLMEDINSGATTDRHLSDQLILFAALAKGRTEYLIPAVTDHVYSNLWLIGKIIGAKSAIDGNRLKIDGIGFYR